MTDLVSSAPGIFEALLGLVRKAGEEQSPQVTVFDWELGQYQPATYITVHSIENHVWDWESIGYQQRELYDVCGCVSVYSGDSPATNKTIGSKVLSETYALFNACVMTQVVSNRTAPFLGTTGPTPQIMLPATTDYKAAPGNIEGGQAGWAGELDWRFHFEAIITPA